MLCTYLGKRTARQYTSFAPSCFSPSQHKWRSLSFHYMCPKCYQGHPIFQFEFAEFIAKFCPKVTFCHEKLSIRLFPFPHIGIKNDLSKSTSPNQFWSKNTVNCYAWSFDVQIDRKTVWNVIRGQSLKSHFVPIWELALLIIFSIKMLFVIQFSNTLTWMRSVGWIC